VTLRPSTRVKLAARSVLGRIAFVRQRSSVGTSITEAPGGAGRRTVRAIR